MRLCALVLGGAVACTPVAPMSSMPSASPATMAGGSSVVPPVKGFAEGEEILFIHTEASDPQVAQMLTDMMHSPVLVVPSLADVAPSALATVYVFRNGVRGDGPFGFQPDVFDRAAGRSDYTPLRRLRLVTWRDGAAARVLRSAGEITAAESRGEIAIETSSAVVNMPMLTWPGGHR